MRQEQTPGNDLSYACRRPKLFTEAYIQLSAIEVRERTYVALKRWSGCDPDADNPLRRLNASCDPMQTLELASD